MINEPKVEPNVYDFVNDKVESTNWNRNDVPYPANGGDANGWGNGNPSLIQRQSTPTVNGHPSARWRSDKAPTVGGFEAYKGAAEVPAFADPSYKEEAAIQTEFLGNPERVTVLDPIAYQTKANTNKIDGDVAIRRTTFYNKKHGVWMGETDML